MQEQCVSPLMPLLKFLWIRNTWRHKLAASSFVLLLLSHLSKSLSTVNSQKARTENGEFDFFTEIRMVLIIWPAKGWPLLTHKHDHIDCRHLHICWIAEGWAKMQKQSFSCSWGPMFPSRWCWAKAQLCFWLFQYVQHTPEPPYLCCSTADLLHVRKCPNVLNKCIIFPTKAMFPEEEKKVKRW